MSDEENRFVRSQGGHDANELHNHGGQDDARDNKTERENLEDEIEALVDDEPTVETVDIVEDDIEVPADEDIEQIAEEEPVADWKDKEENEKYMKNDNIDVKNEPQMTVVERKGGRGWKFATLFFALLAIAALGFAGYFVFTNNNISVFGRTVTSKESGKKNNTISNSSNNANDPDSGEGIATISASQRYIVLDGYDYALRVPKEIENLSYEYHRFNIDSQIYNGNYSTLSVNASTKNTTGAQAASEFLGQYEHGLMSLGSIVISNSEYLSEASAPSLVFKTDDGNYVYYYHPQQQYTQSGPDAEWEAKTVATIESWLTNKDNYVKIK